MIEKGSWISSRGKDGLELMRIGSELTDEEMGEMMWERISQIGAGFLTFPGETQRNLLAQIAVEGYLWKKLGARREQTTLKMIDGLGGVKSEMWKVGNDWGIRVINVGDIEIHKRQETRKRLFSHVASLDGVIWDRRGSGRILSLNVTLGGGGGYVRLDEIMRNLNEETLKDTGEFLKLYLEMPEAEYVPVYACLDSVAKKIPGILRRFRRKSNGVALLIDDGSLDRFEEMRNGVVGRLKSDMGGRSSL